jgi:hypothetical protein
VNDPPPKAMRRPIRSAKHGPRRVLYCGPCLDTFGKKRRRNPVGLSRTKISDHGIWWSVVCTENLTRVDDVMESLKLAE